MAFCCSSISSNGKKDVPAAGGAPQRREQSYRYKAAADAAVDISNFLVNPGSKVPAIAPSLLSHSKVPTTRPRDLAGNRMPPAPRGDRDYYEKISGVSPAALAPPASVREHPSIAGSIAGSMPPASSVGTSVAPSCTSGKSTPRKALTAADVESLSDQSMPGNRRELSEFWRQVAIQPPAAVGQPPAAPRAAEVDALYLWKREVSEWRQDIEDCLKDLAEAIRNEDFERAKQLKEKRDELTARPIPEPPASDPEREDEGEGEGRCFETQVQTDDARGGRWLELGPENYGGDNSVMGSSTLSSRYPPSYSVQPSHTPSGRSESGHGGLGFLFSVWQHNPVYIPKPEDVHH
jgi:hypothetical protein